MVGSIDEEQAQLGEQRLITEGWKNISNQLSFIQLKIQGNSNLIYCKNAIKMEQICVMDCENEQ